MTTGVDTTDGSRTAAMGGPVQQEIERKLIGELSPEVLSVENESSGHSVPPGSESHFRVLVVSSSFEGANRLARHRAIQKALSEELAGPVHALAIEAFAPDEWRERIATHGDPRATSPECRGGSKLG